MVSHWKLFVLFSAFSSAPVFAQSQIHFETKKMKLGKAVIKVEIADTSERQARGLMYRRELKDGHGMLFIFPIERTQSFWMKNTFVPLDIGFFNQAKELVDIQQMDPVGSVMEIPKSYVSKAPAKYALEVPRGWFARAKIEEGARFNLD